jgi:multiple sugar transport system substrate-binding protein
LASRTRSSRGECKRRAQNASPVDIRNVTSRRCFRAAAAWVELARRWVGTSLLLAASLPGSMGCSRTESTALELWAAGSEGEVVAALLPEFEAQNPGVHVHVQQLAWRGAHEKLLTAVVGESTPDVASLGNTWLPEFAMIGALETLDEQVARSSVLTEQDYFSGVLATNRFEGHLYGVPWYVDTRLLFYRTDLAAQAGVGAPPTTWAEWTEMLRKLQAWYQARQRPGIPLLLALYEPEPFIALALQPGEPLLRDGDRYGNFQSQGFQRALRFYVGLFQAGLAPLASQGYVANQWEEFARGNLASFVSGPWQLGELARRLPRELAGSWAAAPLPGPDGPGSSLALGASLVVFAGSKKKEAAWKLVEYLSRPEVQRRFYTLTGDLPPRRASWAGAELESEPRVGAFRAQLERVEPTPPIPEWERISDQITIVAEHTARGTLTVESAARELDSRTERILEKRRWMLDRRAKAPPAPPATGAAP